MVIDQEKTENELEHLPFSFSGNASEYFGIWIVNLLLSILTIGIYTAWAKVRRLRYFYGNTWLGGHNFEYHASPKQILIGRIIVFVVLVAINLVSQFFPLFAFVVLLIYLGAIPWLINKALGFNARMTSYRNIRLGFTGTYWGAFLAFVIMPIAAMFSLGLVAPLASQVSNNYIGNGMRYGSARFNTNAPAGKLYGNLGATIVFVIVASLVAGLVGFVFSQVISLGELMGQLSGVTPADVSSPKVYWSVVAGLIIFYIVTFFAFVFYLAGVRNIAYNATTLEGGHRFKSTLSRIRYFWIIVSNFFLVIMTVGLLRPWAAIRTWRYKAENTAFLASGSLDQFVTDSQQEGNVAAAEYFDIEGIDFGL